MACMLACTHRTAFVIRNDTLPALVPFTCAVDHGHGRQHHRDPNKHTHHGGQRRAGLEAEQHDGRGHRQHEEVAGTDQGRGAIVCSWIASASGASRKLSHQVGHQLMDFVTVVWGNCLTLDPGSDLIRSRNATGVD